MRRALRRLALSLLGPLLALGCGAAAPRYPIGHCSADVVAMQRAVMTFKVGQALAGCVSNPEDCAAADGATRAWLDARQACR